jgi:serine/threonine-protein kinase LATS1/2
MTLVKAKTFDLLVVRYTDHHDHFSLLILTYFIKNVDLFLQVVRWRETLHIPKGVISLEAEDLIRGLCTDPSTRLGRVHGAEEIKRHPFLNGIDFSKSIRLQKAPWKPEILHETDTSNFDPIDPARLLNDNSDSENDEKKDSHGFYEFTFRRFFDDGGHPLPLADDRSSTTSSSASTATSTSAAAASIAPDPVYV